jgi:hypothetical protein
MQYRLLNRTVRAFSSPPSFNRPGSLSISSITTGAT